MLCASMMTALKRILLLAAALAAMTAITPAQEGHPLTGTWSGDWGPVAGERRHITVVMNWDGKAVTGVINPGPDAIPLKSVSLDVTNWTVRLEAEGKEQAGPVLIVAEGRLEDLGSYHRRLVGTWSQGTAKGDLRLTRD
jgi:hypothetical protein